MLPLTLPVRLRVTMGETWRNARLLRSTSLWTRLKKPLMSLSKPFGDICKVFPSIFFFFQILYRDCQSLRSSRNNGNSLRCHKGFWCFCQVEVSTSLVSDRQSKPPPPWTSAAGLAGLTLEDVYGGLLVVFLEIYSRTHGLKCLAWNIFLILKTIKEPQKDLSDSEHVSRRSSVLFRAHRGRPMRKYHNLQLQSFQAPTVCVASEKTFVDVWQTCTRHCLPQIK